MGQRLEALLWDVDGTLAETEFDGHRHGFNLAFQEAGLPWHWDPETYRGLLAVSGGRERLAAYRHQQGEAPWPRERLETLMAAKQRHYVSLVAAGGLALRPGVAPLIAEAQAAGIPQAIVTTSSRSAVAALLGALAPSLSGAFAFWVCGEDVARKKPDPQGYQRALDQLELSPGAVVVLEDSVAGLTAATAADLPCLVTLSDLSRREPVSEFLAAAAVVDNLEPASGPVQVQQGPACDQTRVTLAYLHKLLERR
jgi:HAD superfamily hydrolase (TIGR01509 family)